jgi:putative GTP pyrophosphokinase
MDRVGLRVGHDDVAYNGVTRMTDQQLLPDKDIFLGRYRLTAEEFEKTGLGWTVLQKIAARHIASLGELQATADYVSQRLRGVPAVHSLKVRVKHPEHLIEKIIRKKLVDAELDIAADNYPEVITDLIGIRALHLFKDQWEPIHDFVTSTWDLHETPIAYVREGDGAQIQARFKDRNCEVKEHPIGYRSVHYLLESQPTRVLHLTELQVRTLFEEGWSEIDHQIRYPRLSEDPHLLEFLTIFNRLAGSADEMGTFIKALHRFMREQNAQLADARDQLNKKETELQTAISKLGITEAEKRKLNDQVTALRKSLELSAVPSFSGLGSISGLGSVGLAPLAANYDPSYLASLTGATLLDRTCVVCGKRYKGELITGVFQEQRCPECRHRSV